MPSIIVFQVQSIQEDMDNLKAESNHILKAKEEHAQSKRKLEDVTFKLQNVNNEKKKVEDELMSQQTLYRELKKMRGVGEELENMQRCQQVRPFLSFVLHITFANMFLI
jgi:chromosome segregation ATPase